jgi:hypothetical protein
MSLLVDLMEWEHENRDRILKRRTVTENRICLNGGCGEVNLLLSMVEMKVYLQVFLAEKRRFLGQTGSNYLAEVLFGDVGSKILFGLLMGFNDACIVEIVRAHRMNIPR